MQRIERTCWGKSERKEFRKPFCQSVSLIEQIDSFESDCVALFHNSLSCLNRHHLKASQEHGLKKARCIKHPSLFQANCKAALHLSLMKIAILKCITHAYSSLLIYIEKYCLKNYFNILQHKNYMMCILMLIYHVVSLATC